MQVVNHFSLGSRFQNDRINFEDSQMGPCRDTITASISPGVDH